MNTPEQTRHERFELRRQLGTGGNGEVWEVFDRERGALVAMKRLLRVDAPSILRFKNEFRGLARISHPNLAQLYELVSDGAEWSFTMELVDGRDFVSAVLSSTPGALRYDDSRLRNALGQLVHGLRALHGAGKLHCDVKPQNVLVDARGRVVILDFGLARSLRGSAKVDPTNFVGTPHYMAPEQIGGAPTTEAADWYGVGVMLFEILVGAFPVDGNTVVQLLLRKQTAPSPSDEAFPPGTAPDLRRMCQALLAPRPEDRPSAETLLSMLGAGETEAPPAVVRDADLDVAVVGRGEVVDALAAAFDRVADDGTPRLVGLAGPSGIGKTVIANHFLQGRPRQQGWVLESRCWENESVPYKALDGAIDELVEQLAHLPDSELEGLLTGNLPALVRVFPAMERLPVVQRIVAKQAPANESPRTRLEAFRALRELLVRLSSTRVLTLLVDDAQWGDVDSARALREILAPPMAPRLFVLLTYRDVEAAGARFLETLTEGSELPLETIELGALAPEAAAALALEHGVDSDRAARIAAEAGGDPFLIQQLATDSDSGASVAGTFARRLARLTPDERLFVDTLALAAAPVEPSIICAASGAHTDLPLMMARLRNERLLRTRLGARGDVVEPYHDRVRQTVQAAMSASRRQQVNLRFARTLERQPKVDPQLLAHHFREGGERGQAARYAWQAGDHALEMLAYDRAADAYADALRDGDWSDAEARTLHELHGTVLSYLGRGGESAGALVHAAGLAGSSAAIELRRRAAEQLLRTGHFVRGRELLESLLREQGVTPPRSGASLTAALVWEAARSGLRGTRFELRSAPLDAAEAARVDTLWTASNLMAAFDPKWGIYYTLLNLRRSLECGEPERIARTLGLLAVQKSARSASREEGKRLFAAAEALVADVTDPTELVSVLAFFRGMGAYMSGDIRTAHREFAGATALIADQSRLLWERQFIEIYDLHNLYHLGRLPELRANFEVGARDAGSRDDLMQWSAFTIWGHVARLAADTPEVAADDLRRSQEAWQVPGAYLAHDYWRLCAHVRVALYEGRWREARDLIAEQWRGLRGGFFLSLDLTRAIVLDLRARANLGLASTGSDATRHEALRAARADARRLHRIAIPWARAAASILDAQVATLDGDRSAAEAAYARAEIELGSTGQDLMLAAVRARAGALSADLDVERALQWFSERGVVDPAKFLGMLIPVGGSTG